MNITDCHIYSFEEFYYIQAFLNVGNTSEIVEIADDIINNIINKYKNSYLYYISNNNEQLNCTDCFNINYIIALESQGNSIFPGESKIIKTNKLDINEMSKLSTDGNFLIFGNGDILKLMRLIENKNFKRSDLLRLIIKNDFNIISFVDYFSFMMIFKDKHIVDMYFPMYIKDIKDIEERVINLQFKE